MNTQIQEVQLDTYPAYKDSGVEWLGKIPEHWEVLSNKFIFNLKKNLVGKNSRNYELLSLTLRGVVIRNIEDGGKFPAEYDTYQEVNEGDFVFCLFDVEETPRCIGLSKHAGMITGAYTVMESKKSYDSNFLYYFYLNLDTDKRLRPLYTGLRNTISKDDFFAFKTFVPPLSEQTAIANFLDDKCAKIDAAVEIKQQQIELLKERRQIAIHQAVTQGLDPSVPMKDSGVEWIGEIPEHWEVKRLKFIFEKIQTGTTPSTLNQDFYDGNIDWYNPKDLNNEILKKADKTINNQAIFRNESKLFYDDSILIVGIGATTGKTSYLIKSATFNQQITGFKTFKNHNKFYFWFLKSISGLLLKIANYTTLPILNNDFFKNLDLLLPSFSEQIEISNFLDATTQKIDSAISLYEQEIEKLKEYKTTLINSAVTGKIKVNC